MKKNILFYSVACILLVVSFLFFNKAHEELISLAEFSNRTTIVYSGYQDLSKQINNAAVINPDLLETEVYSDGIALFHTDSATVIQQLDSLRSAIRDSINLRITDQLSERIRQELPWLLKSNVPDSIINNKAPVHIAALRNIDSLISAGIDRTNFLFGYRKEKLNESISNLRAWMFFSILLSCILLIYTTISLFWQKSQRRKKEEELQRKELQFRNTLDVMMEGIQIHDFDWKYTYVNDALVKYSTYSKEELLGHTLMEKYPGIEKSELFRTLEKCMNERVTEHIETEFVFPNGTKAFFELSIQPVPEGIFILSVDITKRKKTEQTLEKSMKELSDYKFALDESAILAITDQKGIIKHVNANFCRISKFSESELVGQDHRIINSGYHSTEFIRDLWVTIANGKIWKGEMKNRAKDGSIYWVDTTIVPFLNDAGKSYQYVAIRSDITERKKAEEKVLKTYRLYRFLSGINQSIVQINNQKELLDTACTIATDIGQFKLAYVGMLDEDNKLNVVSIRGDEAGAQRILKQAGFDYTDPVHKNMPTVQVMRTGRYAFNNDMQSDPDLSRWKDEFILQEINSSISLPIFKFGKVVGIFGLHAGPKDFFDDGEIALLDEAANDISFALGNFEKERIHKEVEELIEKNEKRFRSLIEKSADMKTLTDSGGEFIYASPSVSKVFEYTTEEFLSKSVFDFFHPDDIPDLMENRAVILEAPGKSFNFQYRLLHKKGNWIWCEGTLTNMLHEPAINALVSNFRDISEKKIAEQQKEFDQNNLTALINNTNDLMWSLNRDYKLITFNRPFFETTKLATGKELAKGDDIFSAVLSEEQRSSFNVLYLRAFTGESFTEVQYVDKPVESWIEISFYPIKKDEEVIGTACHSRDITERKKAEFEREKMIADIIQRNRNFEQFAYIVSHNLRAPVANILGISNILKTELSEEERAQTQQFLFQAVEHLNEIIQDLNKILLARTEVAENKENVCFSDLVGDIESSIRNVIQKQGVQIRTDFSAINKVTTLKSYIHSIFYNLITNSIKYSRQEIPPVIQIKSEIVGEKIRIAFKDNGLGIDLNLHGQDIFGLYKRFHLNVEGKGLGLFMVKAQLEVLRGNITVQSEPGQGTEFMIELPI